MTNGRRDAGFTYLGVIFLVAALGAGAAATAEVWSHSRQRAKEAELLWIGHQFRQAIALYYQRTPGALKRYPETLEDLVLDPRHPGIQRYLRRVYADPITGKADWALIEAPGGGVMGVRSRSERVPIRTLQSAGSASAYSQWKFSYEPIELAAGRKP